MLNIRHPLAHAFPLVAACLVFGSSTAFASSLIGSRDSSVTLNIAPDTELYLTGLSSSEAASVTPGNYLTLIQPYDAEKTGLYDTNLCWAATSANMLAYTGWGNVNGFQTEDDILAYFATSFTDLAGNDSYANEWFLNGTYRALGENDWAQPKPGGGTGNFWPDANASYSYVDMTSNTSELDSLLPYLQDGYAVSLMLGWYEPVNGVIERTTGHTVTVWGASYNTSTGNLLSLLISDSDNSYGNGIYGVNAPDLLHEIFLVYNADGYYQFSNYYLDGRLEGFSYLSSVVPEPPVYLMFGLGILTLMLAKRKKHQ
jgi:hypothetical protein